MRDTTQWRKWSRLNVIVMKTRITPMMTTTSSSKTSHACEWTNQNKLESFKRAFNVNLCVILWFLCVTACPMKGLLGTSNRKQLRSETKEIKSLLKRQLNLVAQRSTRSDFFLRTRRTKLKLIYFIYKKQIVETFSTPLMCWVKIFSQFRKEKSWKFLTKVFPKLYRFC